MTKKLRILGFGAHPDDVEFMAAGTLAILKARGHKIFTATVANGSCGTMEYTAREIVKIRNKEARKASAILEAPSYCCGIPDLEVDNIDPLRRKVVAILRKVRPDLVITHDVNDYMIDHVSTSSLVKDGCFCAAIPNYKAGKNRYIDHIPYLYYSLPMEGKDRYGDTIKPRLLIDITREIIIKEKMLACHESQRNWLRRQHGMDQYIETMKEWARKLGKMAGVAYAEGFRQHLGHGFPQEDILTRLIK